MPLAAKMHVTTVEQSGGGTHLTTCIAKRRLDAWPPADWKSNPNISTIETGVRYHGHDYEEGGCCHDEWGIVSVYVPGQSMERVQLSAVTGDASEDDPNRSWSIATPAGNLDLTIANPEAWGFFEPGAEYILKITKHQPNKARTKGDTDGSGS